MAQLIIDFPNAQATRIQDALCARFDYDPEGGETKAAFCKRIIASHIRSWVKEHELNTAVETARTTELNKTDDLNIT